MDVFVDEIGKDLAHIEWDTSVKCPGKRENTFRLENHHGSFIFDCEITRLPTDHRYHKTAFEVSCRVIQKLNSGNKLKKKKSRPKIPENGSKFPRKPVAIWVTVNRGKRLSLQRNSEAWELKEKGRMSFGDEPSSWDDIELTFSIIIQFPSLSEREKNVLDKLTKMFIYQTDCDVQFKINKEEIGSHALILSAVSPVFAAMFKHDTKESLTRQVVIEDVPMDIFKELLIYIYSSRLETSLNERKAKLLFQAAHKYEISELMDECIDFIISCCIRVDNVLTLMSWAQLYSISQVNEVALPFIGRHSQKIYEQEEWRKFIKSQPDLTVLVTRFVSKFSTSP